MESVEVISGEWGSLSEMYFNEEANFAAQLFDNCSLPNKLSWGLCFDLPTLLPDHEFAMSNVGFDNNTIYSLENVDTNQILSTNNSSNLMDYYIRGGDLQPETIIREPEIPMPEESLEEQLNNPLKKRPHNSGHVQKNKSRKNQRILSNEEDDNAAVHKQSSSNFRSEDESEGTTELNTLNSTSKSKGSVALNLNGRKRTSRGSATDHQSIYARKRRERINERLRVLQNLVPNGTKVDISTMLEEAVQYVKFLQLQIKLLSSDDLWMYAPIAYNGMEIGLVSKITSPR